MEALLKRRRDLKKNIPYINAGTGWMCSTSFNPQSIYFMQQRHMVTLYIGLQKSFDFEIFKTIVGYANLTKTAVKSGAPNGLIDGNIDVIV